MLLSVHDLRMFPECSCAELPASSVVGMPRGGTIRRVAPLCDLAVLVQGCGKITPLGDQQTAGIARMMVVGVSIRYILRKLRCPKYGHRFASLEFRPLYLGPKPWTKSTLRGTPRVNPKQSRRCAWPYDNRPRTKGALLLGLTPTEPESLLAAPASAVRINPECNRRVGIDSVSARVSTLPRVAVRHK